MQGDSVHVVVALLEDFAIPFEIGGNAGAAGSASDELKGRIDVAHLSGGVLSFKAVCSGGHVADLPGAVHLIAKAPVLDFVGVRDAVLTAEITPARAFLDV